MDAQAGQKLVGRATRSGIWVLSGRFGDAGLRFVSNIILAGLLFPEAFGLMGLVNIFLMGLTLFSDTGIGPSIVRSERGEDKAFLDTAFAVQVIRGALLSLVCLALAAPFAAIYGDPELERIIPWAGLSALLNGLRSPNWFLADRRMEQGRKTWINLGTQVVSLGVTIVWAMIDRSVDALVAGTLVSAGLHAVLTHTSLSGPRAAFRIEREALREQFDFGRWIFLSTALTFIAMQGDRLFLGWALKEDIALLGVYFIAWRMVELVITLVQRLSMAVVFPAWTESHRLSPEEHVERVLQSRMGLMSLGIAALVGIGTAAPALFGNLYDPRYEGAIALTQWLLIPAWLTSVKSTLTSAVLVYGDSRSLSQANLVNLLVTAPACVLGFYWAELPGFIVGTSLGTLSGNLPLLAALRRHGCPLGTQDAALSLRLAVLAGVGIAVTTWFPAGRGEVLTALWQLALACGLALLALAPARHLLAHWRTSKA